MNDTGELPLAMVIDFLAPCLILHVPVLGVPLCFVSINVFGALGKGIEGKLKSTTQGNLRFLDLFAIFKVLPLGTKEACLVLVFRSGVLTAGLDFQRFDMID